MLTSVVGSFLLFGLVWSAARRITVIPTGLATQAIEAASEALLSFIETVIPDRRLALRVFPLLATLFLFILVNNWLGLVPGVGSITVNTAHGSVPLFRGATADLNTTLALALISVVATHLFALRRLGVVSHLRKYVSLNPLLLFVGLLELVSEGSKVISFAFRLFGNIFAGEVLLVVIAYLAPTLAPLPFFVLELFVGLVQALVFTTLTLVFLGIATSEHGEHEQSASATSTTAASPAPTVEAGPTVVS